MLKDLKKYNNLGSMDGWFVLEKISLVSIRAVIKNCASNILHAPDAGEPNPSHESPETTNGQVGQSQNH